MVILIAGDTHTGKTYLARKMLKKYQYPYLSIDHLKMGLIRSGSTKLIPTSPWESLTNYLWPIIVGIIKTNIENHQNIIIEGSYIPFNYKSSFNQEELNEMRLIYLIFDEGYILNHFDKIKNNANIIEKRLDDDHLTQTLLIIRSKHDMTYCNKYDIQYTIIDEAFNYDDVL